MTQPLWTLTSISSAGNLGVPHQDLERNAADVCVLAAGVIEQANLELVEDRVDAFDLAGVTDGDSALAETADGAAQRHNAVVGRDRDLIWVGNPRVQDQRIPDRIFNGGVR